MDQYVNYVNFVMKEINDCTDAIYEDRMDKEQDQVNKHCDKLIRLIRDLKQ